MAGTEYIYKITYSNENIGASYTLKDMFGIYIKSPKSIDSPEIKWIIVCGEDMLSGFNDPVYPMID